MNKHELIDKIRRLPDQVEALVAGLTAEQLTARPLAGEWSIAQNVHHLADSHLNSYIRCKLTLTEVEPPLKPYDQNVWAELPDACSADVSASLALLRGLHGRWVIFWSNLKDSDWERAGIHGESGRVTLADQLRYYAAHGEGHLAQIQQVLDADRDER